MPLVPPSRRSLAFWLWLPVVWLIVLAGPNRLPHAAQLSESAELAQRPQQRVPVDPSSLPDHLRPQSDSAIAPDPRARRSIHKRTTSAAPLPEAIRGVRFNAPAPTRQRMLSEVQDAGGEETAGSGEHSPQGARGGGGGFELSPLVIAITVDGQVHALERETGQWRWTLHDDGGVALSGVGRGSGHERKRRSSAGAAVGGPLVKSASRRRRNMTRPTAASSNETGIVPASEDEDDADEQYIIEPTGDGDIYVFSRSSGGLDKLPLSMQELVNLSPFRFPGDASRMFSASKNTKFVGVDLKTGRLVGVFGSSAGWCEWDEADELMTGGAAKSTDQDCEDDIAMRPQDLLYMARTEYHLSIYDTTSSQPLQTLSYTTYSSSTLPHVSPVTAGASGEYPSQATWTRTPDSLYLQPMHDGSLVCFRAGQPGIFWTIDFEAPVVSVFDVVVPASSSDVQPSESDNAPSDERHPVMFEQPHPLLVPDLPLDFALLQREPAATFVGRVVPTDAHGESRSPAGSKGGELFAMSRDRFPLVPFAQVADIAQGQISTQGGEGGEDGLAGGEDSEVDAPAPPRKPCRGLDCLIGRHRLLHPPPPSPIGIDATLDPGTPEPLLIEGGGDSSIDTSPSPSSPYAGGKNHNSPQAPHRRSPHLPGSSTLLSRFYESSVRELSGQGEKSGGRLTIGVLAIVLAIWWWTKIRKTASQPSKVRYIDESFAAEPSNRGAATASGSGSARNGISQRKRSPSSPPTPTDPNRPTAVRRRSSSVSLLPAVPISAVSKELPPLPPAVPSIDGAADPSPPPALGTPAAQTGGDAEDGDSDSGGGPEGPTAPGSPPRKRNRRRRGAKKKKPKEGVAGLGDELADDRDLLEGIALSERDTRDEDGEPGTQADGNGGVPAGESAGASKGALLSPEEAVAPPRVDSQLGNGLSVSETILGYGSHGTVVLRGEFQGRAVAVKRLLKDFVTIATHEVNLLQESDDHPHVIRYFCKEQRDTFLYIALELCPASLFDLIDQPASHPELVAQLDPKKALKQVASGLRHLHSLKIVHRDIKPQNILVSTAKRGQPGLRMLISDFGLCKKLDVDESSFQQTINHAAGSFGYRAPEVLRGLVDPNETANGAATPSGSTGSGGSSSTLAGLTSTDPSMRLTRSIDIFSLGCIFYFVLTGGEHPFGGRYEREMNILQGKASLERLDGLGEEAVEVQDLILRMVATDPRERPTADAVLLHPFFWNAQKRLLFLCDASDRFEIMERDPPAPTLITLEKRSRSIVGDDWQKALDRTFLDNLGKYRKYDGASVRDLLRVLRNKKHHYQDLPENVRRALGDLPGGFLTYFTARFPHLLLHVYDTVAVHLADEAMFSSTFRIPEDEG
ncbi:hypothetical protein JCM10908_006463 [Rhodotorula pacifica]|uniref:bifunctional endoribonuclease/protein kinase IRE1 n=1 Tax=Rhodotorula pacifica TaxID=1495444 RepID=UPI00316D124F